MRAPRSDRTRRAAPHRTARCGQGGAADPSVPMAAAGAGRRGELRTWPSCLGTCSAGAGSRKWCGLAPRPDPPRTWLRTSHHPPSCIPWGNTPVLRESGAVSAGPPSLPPAHPPAPPQPRYPGPAAPAGAAPEGGERPGRSAASPAGAPPRRLPRRRLINNAGPGRGHGPAGASWQRCGPPASDSGRGSAPRPPFAPGSGPRNPTAAGDPRAPAQGQPVGGRHGHTAAAGLGARCGPRCCPLRPSCRTPLPGTARGKEPRTRTSLRPTGMGEVHPQLLPKWHHRQTTGQRALSPTPHFDLDWRDWKLYTHGFKDEFLDLKII